MPKGALLYVNMSIYKDKYGIPGSFMRLLGYAIVLSIITMQYGGSLLCGSFMFPLFKYPYITGCIQQRIKMHLNSLNVIVYVNI
jgi:hypothetical protein